MKRRSVEGLFQHPRYVLTKQQTVYTEFTTSLDQITRSEAGNVKDFINVLQTKLDEKLNDTPPDNQTIDKLF